MKDKLFRMYAIKAASERARRVTPAPRSVHKAVCRWELLSLSQLYKQYVADILCKTHTALSESIGTEVMLYFIIMLLCSVTFEPVRMEGLDWLKMTVIP